MSTPGAETPTVAPARLAQFTRQLGAMLDSGVDVLRALRIAGQHTGEQRLIDTAAEIGRLLEDGREFHQALPIAPDLFDSFYVEMARQGETDGSLGRALLSVADYLDHAAMGSAPAGTASALPRGQAAPLSEGARAEEAGVAATLMLTLGVLSVGAAAIWSASAAAILPAPWLGPLVTLWSGLCFLAGARPLRRERTPEPPTDPPALPPLPPKSARRKAAETEGVVRSALQEQEEDEEERALRDANAVWSRRSSPGRNGTTPSADARPQDPDEEGPPFQGQ